MLRTVIGDQQSLLSELERWSLSTPTTDGRRVNALMVSCRRLAEADVSLTRIPGRDGYGDNLIVRVDHRSGVKPILVVGHSIRSGHQAHWRKCLSGIDGIVLTVRHPGYEAAACAASMPCARSRVSACRLEADHTRADARRGSRQPASRAIIDGRAPAGADADSPSRPSGASA